MLDSLLRNTASATSAKVLYCRSDSIERGVSPTQITNSAIPLHIFSASFRPRTYARGFVQEPVSLIPVIMTFHTIKIIFSASFRPRTYARGFVQEPVSLIPVIMTFHTIKLVFSSDALVYERKT